MGSSTTERAGDGESSLVGDNTYSSDDGKATDLLEPDPPSVEKVAVRRARLAPVVLCPELIPDSVVDVDDER
jgi:hypothetical protein